MAGPPEQTAASPSETLSTPDENSQPGEGEASRPGRPPLASRSARNNRPRAAAQAPAIGTGELSRQFEVIRKVLDARKAAGLEVEPEALPEPEPVPIPVVAKAAEPEPVVAEPVWQIDQGSFVSQSPESTATDEIAEAAPGTDDIAVHRSRATTNHRSRSARRTGRGQLIALIVVVIAVLSSAIAAGFAVTHRQVVVTTVNPVPTVGAPTVAETNAAAWIVTAVGPSKVVACDVSVCALLLARGFPSSSLVTVHLGLSDVEQADAVVLTPVLRAQLGSSVNAIISTEPLAVFGTGANRVEVAAVALTGPSTYAQNLSADRVSRRSAGAALLGNTRLTVTGAARAMLANGLVDARICALLALLTGSHSIVVSGFTPIPPGAGPDVPSAGVLIKSVDGQTTAGPSAGPTRQLLLTLIAAQQDPYLPLSAGPGTLGATSGLAIVYAQPGPLGLLTGATS